MIDTGKHPRPSCVEQVAQAVIAVDTHPDRSADPTIASAQQLARVRDHGSSIFTVTPTRRGDRPAHQEQP
ncbi:MAG: hypothetical protein H0W72_07680 [Planctomycetes bacterium]|nr:hypothetical protein [Planctomycetota bacterium]